LTTSGADGERRTADDLIREARRFVRLEVGKLRAELVAHAATGHIPASFAARVDELDRATHAVDALFRKHGLIE